MIMTQALNAVGAGTDMGKDLLDILKKLSKYLPATPPSAGLMNAGMRNLMLAQRQGGANQDLVRALQLRSQPLTPPPEAGQAA